MKSHKKGMSKAMFFFSPNSLIRIEIRLKMNILCGSLVKRVDDLRWVWPFFERGREGKNRRC